jgi:hypothetical protein
MERCNNPGTDDIRRRRAMRGAVAISVLQLLLVACGAATRVPIAAPAPEPPERFASPLPLLTVPAPPLIIHPPPSPRTRNVSRSVRAPALQYGGVWTGQAVPTHCRESGGATGVACALAPDAQRLRLHLTSKGNSASGVLQLGPMQLDVTGTVADDGTLTLGGQHSGAGGTVIVSRWRSSVDGTVMNGTFRYSIEAAEEELGTVTVTALFDELVKER